MSGGVVETLDCIDRGKSLLEWTRCLGQLERHVLTVARQAMSRAGQTHMIDLKAVQQPGLHDPLTVLDLVHQPVQIGQQVLINAVEIRSQNSSEKQPTEAWQRIDGQKQMAERKPPGGGNGAGMPHFKFGQ